jgi:hypothetical protein
MREPRNGTRTFAPEVLHLADAMDLTPEEVDAAVFRVRSNAWAQRRAFMGEAEALKGVGLVLGFAEVGVEEAVRKFRDAGGGVPDLPQLRQWGLRRGRRLPQPRDEADIVVPNPAVGAAAPWPA